MNSVVVPISRETVAARRSVALMFFLNGTLIGGLIAYYPVVQQTLHLTDQELGLSMFFSPLGAILAIPNLGRIISRYGSRSVILITALLLSAEIPLALAAPNIWLFRLGLLLFGALNSMQDVSLNAQAVTIQHRYPRPMISSTHGCWSIGGFVAGGGISLAARLGQSPVVHTATMDVIVLAIFVLCYSKLLPKAEEDIEEEPGLALPKGPLLLLGLLTCFAFAAEGAAFDWVAVYFRLGLHTSQQAAALGFAAFAVSMASGRTLGDSLVHRLGSVKTLRYGSLVSASGMILAVLMPTPVLSGIGFMICGVGLANIVPILFRAAGSVDGVSTGTGIAAVSACGYASFFLSPPLIGAIADHASLSLALGLVGMLALIVGLMGKRALSRTRLIDGAGLDVVISP